MLITFFRSIVLYIIVLVVMRLMGKREISQMQPFELAISIMIADLASIPMTEIGIPIFNGIVPILGLLLMHLVISVINIKSIALRKFICGKPSILIYKGKQDDLNYLYTHTKKKYPRDLKYFNDTVEKIRKFENIYKDYIKISMHRKEKFCATAEVCPGGERFFYISPEGFVSPCSWVKKMDSSFTSRKSLINTPFSEIIKEDGIQRFNKMKYERNELYKTGCPAICKERNNTYYSKDPLLDVKVEEKEVCCK